MSDINVGAITEALNDKMDRDAHNVQSPSAVVVETCRNRNNFYNKYSDGWVEQGGESANSGTSGTSVTLLVTMSDTSYIVLVSPSQGESYGTSGYGAGGTSYGKTTTGFKVYSNNNGGRPAFWVAMGYAAS